MRKLKLLLKSGKLMLIGFQNRAKTDLFEKFHLLVLQFSFFSSNQNYKKKGKLHRFTRAYSTRTEKNLCRTSLNVGQIYK